MQQCACSCPLPVQMFELCNALDTISERYFRVQRTRDVLLVSNFLSSFPPPQAELHNSCGEQLPNGRKRNSYLTELQKRCCICAPGRSEPLWGIELEVLYNLTTYVYKLLAHTKFASLSNIWKKVYMWLRAGLTENEWMGRDGLALLKRTHFF